MKKLDDFKLANEMLEKILGGHTSSTPGRFFSFQGEYAVAQANNVRNKTFHACGCGCGCGGGAGNGSGAGR